MAQPTPHERPVVIASNRGPLTFRRGDDGELEARRGAGGLVSGLAPLVAGTPTLWLAAAISDDDREAARQGTVEADGIAARLLEVEPEVYRRAYDAVCNEVLWFAHHGLWDLVREPAFDGSWDDDWEAYRALNGAFADAVAETAPDGAAVLVQDYHLCLVAEQLATRRPDLACVHFSHTPFAPPAFLRPLPAAARTELLRGLAAHRACGFHTSRWALDYETSAAELGEGDVATTFVSPLASDPDDLLRAARSADADAAFAELERRVGDRAVIGRVDRVELSKNIVRGFAAFGALLDRHPEHRGRVVFVAGAYPSREGVPAYAAYADEIRATVDAVNERFGTSDWTPILLDVDDDYPRSLAVLRRADVLLVNPIRDGLNLVASEGVLVGERAPVLCLSPEAGAWEHLGEAAVPVPPFDLAGTAAALHEALTLPSDERAARHRRAVELARARTPRHWLADQLAAAR